MVYNETSFTGGHCPHLAYAGGAKIVDSLGVKPVFWNELGLDCLAMDKISKAQPDFVCRILDTDRISSCRARVSLKAGLRRYY